MVKVTFLKNGYSVEDLLTMRDGELLDATTHKLTLSFYGDRILDVRGDFKIGPGGNPKDGEIRSLTLTDDIDGTVLKISMATFNLDFSKFYDRLLDGTLSAKRFMDGNDTIIGSDESDRLLLGYGGNDRINGKDGNDEISGGEGNDRLTGGLGSDTFRFEPHSGKDVITDLEAGDSFSGDRDDVRAVVKSGQDTVIKFYGGDQVTLLGVERSEFSLDDYWS